VLPVENSVLEELRVAATGRAQKKKEKEKKGAWASQHPGQGTGLLVPGLEPVLKVRCWLGAHMCSSMRSCVSLMVCPVRSFPSSTKRREDLHPRPTSEGHIRGMHVVCQRATTPPPLSGTEEAKPWLLLALLLLAPRAQSHTRSSTP